MLKSFSACMFALGAVAAGCGAVADAPPVDDPQCFIAFDAPTVTVPTFDAVPAVPVWTGPLASLQLKSNLSARKFRTVLRKGAMSGPNFAGHYTIVGWGCGASCLNWAVVDDRTGKVHFEQKIAVIATNHVDVEAVEIAGVNADFNALRFRQNSTLLVVLGAPGEDETKEGIGYYRWTGSSFRLLKFIPRNQACRRAS